MTILGLALIALLQLSSQGLRLLRLSEDYQEAVRLADQLARRTEPAQDRVEAGHQGSLRWERRITLVSVPEELTPAAGPRSRLYAVSVAVRWGNHRSLELASLRTVADAPDVSPPERGIR